MNLQQKLQVVQRLRREADEMEEAAHTAHPSCGWCEHKGANYCWKFRAEVPKEYFDSEDNGCDSFKFCWIPF